MKRCASPDHPHCTHWVMPGDRACAHGHAQPADDTLGASFDMISRLRAGRGNAEAIRPVPVAATGAATEAVTEAATKATTEAATGFTTGPARPHPAAERPYLHVSGFDPRAAGGRQAVKLELRGMPPGAPNRLDLLLRSDLLQEGSKAGGEAPLAFTRGLHGDWRPVYIEFSSRGREHGQYRIDVELHAREPLRTWVATLLLLVPRPDASLGEIHQTFLSTHKNVRIHADDASIARIYGLDAAGPMDIDVQATRAGIARLDFGKPGAGGGRIDLGLPTLAWDEDLIEIDLPATASSVTHPCPASSGCLVYAEPDAGFPRHVRIFALDECVLGRFEHAGAQADLLLRHHGDDGPVDGGLTRRLSGRHALIRPGRHGFEIEDLSRYGLLLDGVWPGKHKPVPLRLGMRIELTASFRGVVTLVVTALHAHALVLHRVDAGGAAECFMLLAPETRPDPAAAGKGPHALPRAAAMPLLFHRDGGIWHLDPQSLDATPLGPATALERLALFHGRVRFAARSRPEDAARTDQRRADRRGEPSRLLDA